MTNKSDILLLKILILFHEYNRSDVERSFNRALDIIDRGELFSAHESDKPILQKGQETLIQPRIERPWDTSGTPTKSSLISIAKRLGIKYNSKDTITKLKKIIRERIDNLKDNELHEISSYLVTVDNETVSYLNLADYIIRGPSSSTTKNSR